MKLGTVAKVQGGYAFKSQEFQNEGVPIIRIGNLDGKNVEIDNDVCYPLTFWEQHPEFRVEKNNILIAMSGATVGKIGLYEFEEKALLNQRVCILKPDEAVVDNGYLYFYCLSPKFKKSIQENAFGCAQPNISASQISDFEINVPTVNEQKACVVQLQKIKSIIDKREKELEELDNLIKSRFVEMFGDPVTNSMNLPIATLGELSELITKGASPSWQGFSYTEDATQTLFVTSENVREGYIDISNPKYIEDGFNEKQKRSVLKNGDFLINIVGASIGRAAQFKLDCKANINQAAALVRMTDKRVRDKYLLVYLNSEKAQQMYNSMKSDTGRANLSLQDIGELTILLPPVEKQMEFERFVQQVDKLKFEVQKSLNETQLLMDSLMQEYFG